MNSYQLNEDREAELAIIKNFDYENMIIEYILSLGGNGMYTRGDIGIVKNYIKHKDLF